MYGETKFRLKVAESVAQFVHWSRLETKNWLSHHVVYFVMLNSGESNLHYSFIGRQLANQDSISKYR